MNVMMAKLAAALAPSVILRRYEASYAVCTGFLRCLILYPLDLLTMLSNTNISLRRCPT